MATVPRSTGRQSARQRLEGILQCTLATFTTMDIEIGKTLFLLIVEMLMKACCPPGKELTSMFSQFRFPAQDFGLDRLIGAFA